MNLSSIPTFRFYIQVFMLYILIDTVWVLVKPKSVVSPQTILIHHVGTLAGLVSVFNMGPEYIIVGAAGGLLEVNTFLLIARRNIRDSVVIKILFFGSWIVIRLLMGPWLLYITTTLFLSQLNMLRTTQSQLLAALTITVVTCALNVLNFKWSYDLLIKNVASKEKKSH